MGTGKRRRNSHRPPLFLASPNVPGAQVRRPRNAAQGRPCMRYIYTGNLYPYIYIYTKEPLPHSRATSVLGSQPPPLGLVPNLQNPFLQAGAQGGLGYGGLPYRAV